MMGTKLSTKIMKLGKDEEHDKTVFLVPHSVAVRMFNEYLKCLEEHEASVYNIAILRDLRELAARKRLSGLNQTRIHNFFSKQQCTQLILVTNNCNKIH